MRKTLNLEADVAERIKVEMRQTGRSMTAVVNEALRCGLSAIRRAEERVPFEVEARPLGLKPGFDPDRMNQLLDELQVEESVRRLEK